LIRAGDRYFLDQQRIDSAARIVARHACQPAVDHERDALNGERRFGDIGRDDDFAPPHYSGALRSAGRIIRTATAGRAADCAVLLRSGQLAVQRQALEIPQPAPRLKRL